MFTDCCNRRSGWSLVGNFFARVGVIVFPEDSNRLGSNDDCRARLQRLYVLNDYARHKRSTVSGTKKGVIIVAVPTVKIYSQKSGLTAKWGGRCRNAARSLFAFGSEKRRAQPPEFFTGLAEGAMTITDPPGEL